MKKPEIASVCVFCAASDRVAERHFALATELGSELGARQLTLVYGGGSVGLMGAVARAAAKNGSRIVGVIPDFMRAKELAFEEADEIIVTTTMRERKAEMEARSDAFLVLPGGFGTLEEAVEILTLKQLALHQKPIVILNPCGFFDSLLSFFNRIFEEEFAQPLYRQFYTVVDSVPEALRYLDAYKFDFAENNWHVTT